MKHGKEYKCIRCQKIFNKKCNYEYHINRKNLCKIKPTEITNASIETSPVILVNKKKDYKCTYCDSVFTRLGSLNRHIKDRCQIKKDQEEQKKEILDKLLEEMAILKDKISKCQNVTQITNITKHIQNNNNNNNIQNNTNINNLKIVAFGKEKLDEIIGEEECKKILFRGFEAIPQLIENIHFNNNRPQYHNCYIPNMRTKYAIVYDGDNWKLENAIDVIETLRDNNRNFLERKFEDFYESLNSETKKKFNRFIEEADTDIVKNRYKESIKLLLYNKKDMVIKTRNDNNKKIKLLK